MKKLFLGVLLLLSTLGFVSCEPQLNYECPGYFNKEEWKIVSDFERTNDTLWGLNKKVKLEYNKNSDSTSIDYLPIKRNQSDSLPNGEKLKDMIDDALFKCKNVCRHPETFNPKLIMIYPTFGDEEDFHIEIVFNASNSFGVPGESRGGFTYHKKSFKLKNELIY